MKDSYGSATNTVDILKSSAFPDMQLFAIFYNFKQSQGGKKTRPFHCVCISIIHY